MSYPETMSVEKTSTPLDIAIVYSRLPFPMMRGDQLTIAHLIEFLSCRGHNVYLYTSIIDGVIDEEKLAWLSKRCKSVHLLENPKWKRILNTILNLFQVRPMQVGMFENNKLNKLVRADFKAGKFDVVYNYYLRSASSLGNSFTPNHCSEFSSRKTIGVLALQLSQYLNTVRIAKNETNIIKKVAYSLESKLIRKFEANSWKKATKVALIGPKDVEAVNMACDEEHVKRPNNVIYAAHGTNINKFKRATAEEIIKGRIVFSGSMLYQPNIQAVLWFYDNCWKAIKEKVPTASFYIVGRDPAREILALHNGIDIFVTGTVDDVSSYIRSAEVCINPVFSAGGMQNKLIEYFASSKAVVATSIANEGIRAAADSMFLEANDNQTFVKQVIILLEGEVSAIEMGRSAREFVKQHWTWESHFLKLEEDFRNALDAN